MDNFSKQSGEMFEEPKFDYITPTVELSGVLALPLAVAAEHSVHYKCLLSLS